MVLVLFLLVWVCSFYYGAFHVESGLVLCSHVVVVLFCCCCFFFFFFVFFFGGGEGVFFFIILAL